MNFNVTVIIPVYNAEAYLRNAVQSALAHDCVKEVILIEDKSPDNALSICKELVKEDQRVKLFLHPNNENRGAGASRNLGLKNASSDFISFLDADDWYEPNRFDAESVIFRNPEIDGVYGASGCFNVYNNSFTDELVTMGKEVLPKDLLYEIVRPSGGRFNTNAITVRKSLLQKSGIFNVELRLHQDTELFLRFAYFGNIVGGELKTPISYYRKHSNNRITTLNKASLLKFGEHSLNFFLKQPNVDKRFLRVMLKLIVINKSKSNNLHSRLMCLFFIVIKKPSILFKIV